MLAIFSLRKHTRKRRHKQFIVILFMMLISSVFEVLSIGAVIPFLGVLMSPEKVFGYEVLQPIIHFLDYKRPQQLLLPITLIFISAVLVAGGIRIILLYATTRFSYATGADIAIDIYRRTLYQEYEVHLAQNSSEIINSITAKTNAVISGILNPTLIFISSLVLIFFIVATLLFIDPITCLIALSVVSFFYSMVILYTRKKLALNGKSVAIESTQIIKCIQEGLGGIRDVIIDGKQDFYTQIYRKSDVPYRKALGNNQFINGSPRFVMEAIGMTMIASLAYILSFQEGGVNEAIPVLGALALGAQRILPALQQLFGSYATIKSTYPSFYDVLKILKQPLASMTQGGYLSFESGIHLNDVSFHYKTSKGCVIENVSLTIPKNSLVGFVGVTGSGKSTLIDIIMSLLKPTNGEILIDNTRIDKTNYHLWRNLIAHVPQTIFLTDGTIEENIAFGIPKNCIDKSQLDKAIEVSQLKKLIEGWPNQYETMIGERGVRLSGGQRQRIGIARAIYKQASVLILDEATSALDSETEEAVMNAINDLGQDITILIIAHRLTTLKKCQVVYKVQDGSVFNVESH